MPLLHRLVGIITVLVGAGLVLAGVASATLLEDTLVGQVDSKLESEGAMLAQQQVDALNFGRSLAPNDYYVRVQVLGIESINPPSRSARVRYGTPEVPDITGTQATENQGEPFSVHSTKSGSPWRAVAYPVSASDGSVGSVVVALPLGDVERTVSRMVTALLLTGIGIVLLGALAGSWAVRRSLKPLREIEKTAAAIAAGDLSQRVPPVPKTTEVGRLALALNGMLAQIEHAFDARTASEARMRRFVADASHELRTPLATIRGYGELYRMGALVEKDQVDDTMRRIEDSATRMGGLVEDLLALARLDENRPLRRDPVDLTVLAADAVSDLHALDPTRTSRLEPLVPGAATGPVTVLGEEPRLRQVLANLLGNVVQHTPAGTPVEIAVGVVPGPSGVPLGVVEVRDHGPGIDPEHAARVFERFYRIDASRGRDSGGAGLGMAIVAAIVDAHGGTVGLAQTPGGGTTVRVALPVHMSGSSNGPSA
ncbi:two-component sensor histidine kinase [Cellulomonas chitinilytica]|uniref:histidine kinase n=1 Tax=Cellulomonas chitinilytica TaxID=398759 RepID=A0A919P6Q3_9CELL|nr:HAMP domain-containing sensor histidine kinase [Cellulomonas chitinilytica]GIG22591.1 two-component sensor histidine kinase [Cellulomonas chitinilytica]